MAAETEGFCHASETQFPGGLLPAPVLCRRGRLFRRLRHPGPMRRAGQRPDHEPAGDGHGCPPRKGRQRPAAPAVPGDLFSGHHVHGAAAAPVPCGYAAALPGGGRPGGGGRGLFPGEYAGDRGAVPHFLRHERPVEHLCRGQGLQQLHHLFHQQHQADRPGPGPLPVRGGAGVSGQGGVLCRHPAVLPPGGHGVVLRREGLRVLRLLVRGFARRWTPWRRWPWAFSRRICR